MPVRAPHIEDILPELEFVASRSGGPGGQHVNKVNSKVILKWDVAGSNQLSDGQKETIVVKLSRRMSKNGVLALQEQESRSQRANKEKVVARLDALLQKAFTVKKKRKPTKPTKASVQKRITGKKRNAEKKQWRQKPGH